MKCYGCDFCKTEKKLQVYYIYIYIMCIFSNYRDDAKWVIIIYSLYIAMKWIVSNIYMTSNAGYMYKK